MNNHTIVEKRFPLQHFMTRKIFGDDAFYGTSYEAYSQVVYFDEVDPKIITAKLVYWQDWENEPKGFTRFLDEDLTFDECLIVCTLYFSHSFTIIKQILSQPLNPIEDVLHHIVKPSNGYIIYSYQFEQLAQLILNVNLNEAVRLRKLFNKQRSTMNESKLDKEDLSVFKTVVRDRCILGCVHLPNYNGAKNLMLYAKSIA